MAKTKAERELISKGVPEEEAALIVRAIRKGRSRRNTGHSADGLGLASLRRSLLGGGTKGSRRDKDFRNLQKKMVSELVKVPLDQIAFGDLPDSVREQNSAFAFEMYQGNQAKFIDRKQDETPEEYLDRPGKVTFNVTRLVISILSKLYHEPPERVLEEGTPEEISDRLNAIWSGKLFNLGMHDADALTRLCGVVAIRPMWDPTVAGGIRLWLFMNHQLRVIPDPQRPWKPAAVIERVQPFGNRQEMTIWTDESFVVIPSRGDLTYHKHNLGRIPHVFCKDSRSYTSFFVEGRSRDLAEPNAILNNDLTDLNEVKQMQGFATLEIVNPEEDEIRVGPRQVFTFSPKAGEPYGANYRKPDAPIKELAEDAERGTRRILLTNGVPVAAAGAEIDRRALSGEAIKGAMQPIISDLEERALVFEPIEWDLADSMLRIIARHNPGFSYDPKTQRPKFKTNFVPPSFPLATRDQVMKDEFDIGHGIKTPAMIIRRDNPDDFKTHEEAVEQWQKNLAETRSGGLEIGGDLDTGPDASFGESREAERAEAVDSILGIAIEGGLVEDHG